jgi:cell division septation protein DedD
VILAEDGPRIIDFGIARALDAEVRLTVHGVIGTPAFMSPEQAQGGEAGAASDVFALAGLLVHAVTGRRPFGSGTTYEVLQRVVHEAPDLTGVPASLAELLLPCLDKEPARRPTAVELLDRFAALAESYDAEERRNPDQITTMIVQRGALAATLVLPGESGSGNESESGNGSGNGSGSADGNARRALLGEVAAAVGALYARRTGEDRTVPVVLPPLPGEFASARRVTVIRWFKRRGDAVRAGEGLFSVSDGRARAVVASPAEGVLREVGPGTGEGVSIGALMGVVERRVAAEPKAKGTAQEEPRVQPKPKSKPKAPSKPASQPAPKPKPKPKPAPAPKPAPKSAKSSSDLGGWLGGLGVIALILYLTLYSQDIFEAKPGDCVRIEDSGQGSAYVEPCNLPIPWDDTYQVLDEPVCHSGTVRSWSDDDGDKSISLCLKAVDPWDGSEAQ